jgi:hypothetical protein
MTGPIYLPGWGDSLGQGAQQLGSTIQSIVNPNYQFQKQFEQALMNPQLAQQYADMYSSNPSIFDPKKYGQRNIASLQAMKPSADYTQQQKVKGDIAQRYASDPTFASDIQAEQTKTPNSEQQAQTAETKQRTQINQNMINAVGLLPTDDQHKFWSSAASAKLTGVNDAQAADMAKHIRDMKEQETQEATADAYVKSHPEVLTNLSQTASDLRSGKIPADIGGALTMKYPMLQSAVQLYDHNQDLQHQTDMLTQREAAADTRANTRADTQEKIAQLHDTAVKNRQYQNLAAQFSHSYLGVTNPKSGTNLDDALPTLQNQLDLTYKMGDLGQAPKLSVRHGTKTFLGVDTGIPTKDGVLMFTDPTDASSKPKPANLKSLLPTSAITPSNQSSTNTPSAGANEAANPTKVQNAIARIKANPALASQVDASPSLNAAEKAAIKAGLSQAQPAGAP